ncbi:hypothetical protein [Pontibacter liquoris]|uniref:hypothetical protein n=1 Tax=Pontibacter liquoris TaxID=2905677 RepID=UPI001FA781CC|nr:hypothetical protein [Pontibacter liquoris]
MSFKIDIRKIIRDHKSTLVNQNDGKPDITDKLSFFWGPLVAAALLVYFGALIKEGMISTIVSVLAIFVGLLLNVVVLLFDIVRKADVRKVKVELVREVLANIMYTILLSVACILTSIMTLINFNCYLLHFTNFISYFLLFVFLTTLLMVIKRMYSLFENEVNESAPGL